MKKPAPELQVSHWLNTPKPLSLADFRGRVLIIEAFQMLCPGCVAHGLPQAQRVARYFPREQVGVVGLHTVFEHHEAQGTVAALSAFVHEYRYGFPIGIDAQNNRLPATMTAYSMKGTPTTVVIDRQGILRFQHFGQLDDLVLGHAIGTLLAEPALADANSTGCDSDGCVVPSAKP